MSTVRVTLEAAGDLPEPVAKLMQALINVATADGMSVEYSHKPSLHTAITAGGHDFNFSGMSDEDLAKMTKSATAMTFTGR
jgi:hypothetical protein